MIRMGKTKDVNPWLIDKRGWLQNEDRKKRRNKTRALTDDQVLKLISDIDTMVSYTKLNERYDRLIRERDKALIALGWIFFKRANEVVRVQLKDCHFNEKELTVTFYISKKSKSYRICPECKGKGTIPKESGYKGPIIGPYLEIEICPECGGCGEV